MQQICHIIALHSTPIIVQSEPETPDHTYKQICCPPLDIDFGSFVSLITRMKKQSTLCFTEVEHARPANQGVKDTAACLSDVTNKVTLHGRSSMNQQFLSRQLPLEIRKLEIPVTRSMLGNPAAAVPVVSQQLSAQETINLHLVGSNANSVSCFACQARAYCSRRRWCSQAAALNLTVRGADLAAFGPAFRVEGVPEVEYPPGADMARVAGMALRVRLPGFSDMLTSVCLYNTADSQAVICLQEMGRGEWWLMMIELHPRSPCMQLAWSFSNTR